MFLAMGITGKVRGRRNGRTSVGARQESTRARSAIARRRQSGRTRAWNWLTVIGMIRQPSSGRSKASKARSSCCRLSGPPRPITKEAKGVIAIHYVEARHQGSAAAGSSAFVDGCEQDQRAWDDHGLVASGARFSRSDIANRICARRWILRKLPLRLASRPGRNATGLLQSDKPEIDHGRDERHRHGGRNPFDRASVVKGSARRRAWFDGHRG